VADPEPVREDRAAQSPAVLLGGLRSAPTADRIAGGVSVPATTIVTLTSP
jgi:hypothetical protein